ncbi:hypothetical protein [Deinococcus sp. PESE-13]
MTFWRAVLAVALVPVALLGLGLLALLAGTFYESAVFSSARPTRALGALLQNPAAAKVLQSEQHGAFGFGDTIYTSQAVVQGEKLRLQPYLSPAEPNSIRRVMGGWDTCGDLLRRPDAELKFYAVGKAGPGTLDSYVIWHPAGQLFCLIHVEL